MEFIALDFETATHEADSACEMGLAIVRDGEVREVRNWMIKPRQWPHFSYHNIRVHGIRPEHVAKSPSFAEVWEEALPLLHGATLVAHNAAFDMNVLRNTLAQQRLAWPTFSYFCSVSLSRKVWPDHRSYGLAPMCALHGIHFHHHRAGNDAEAAARLVLKAGETSATAGVAELLQRVKVRCGGFGPGQHRTPGGKVTTYA